MASRSIPVVLAFAFIGAAPALAYDDSLQRERELPCSSLCRSWMGLGRAAPSGAASDRPAAPAPELSTASVPPAVPVLPAVPVPPTVVTAPAGVAPPRLHSLAKPIARLADKPRHVARQAPPRPIPAAALPAVASRVAAIEAPPPAVPAPLEPVVPAAHLVATAQVAPTVGPLPDAVIVQAAPVSAPAPQAEPLPPLVRPIEAAASLYVAASAPASLPPAPTPHGTPMNVKLGFYAVLAAIVGWALGQHRPSAEPLVVPSRRRERSARSVPLGVQHTAVDAL